MIPKTNPSLTAAVSDCDLTAKNLNQMDLRRRANGATSRTGNVKLADMKGSIAALQEKVDNSSYGQNTSVGWNRQYTGAVRWKSNSNTKDEWVSYDSSTDRILVRIGMTYTTTDQTMSALVYGYCNSPGTLQAKWTYDGGSGGGWNVEVLGFASGYLSGSSKRYYYQTNPSGSQTITEPLDPAYPYLVWIGRAVVYEANSNGTTSTRYFKNVDMRLI